jgi:hypothetical protein
VIYIINYFYLFTQTFLVSRGPNFATFHFRHVSDEEEEEGGSTIASFPFRHVSDDEETKKNTPR